MGFTLECASCGEKYDMNYSDAESNERYCSEYCEEAGEG